MLLGVLSKGAQNAPTPITNYALFHDGEYVTNEQMNDTKFLKLVLGKMLKDNKIKKIGTYKDARYMRNTDI